MWKNIGKTCIWERDAGEEELNRGPPGSESSGESTGKALPLETSMQQKTAHPGHRSLEFAADGRLSSENVVPEQKSSQFSMRPSQSVA